MTFTGTGISGRIVVEPFPLAELRIVLRNPTCEHVRKVASGATCLSVGDAGLPRQKETRIPGAGAARRGGGNTGRKASCTLKLRHCVILILSLDCQVESNFYVPQGLVRTIGAPAGH